MPKEKVWTSEDRRVYAKILLGLRNGTFRPWEQLSTYEPEHCVITRKRNKQK